MVTCGTYATVLTNINRPSLSVLEDFILEAIENAVRNDVFFYSSAMWRYPRLSFCVTLLIDTSVSTFETAKVQINYAWTRKVKYNPYFLLVTDKPVLRGHLWYKKWPFQTGDLLKEVFVSLIAHARIYSLMLEQCLPKFWTVISSSSRLWMYSKF
jgi:hypothetical protein